MRGSPNEIVDKNKAFYRTQSTAELERTVERLTNLLAQPWGIRNRIEAELRYKAVCQVIEERDHEIR